ncbi:MAG: ATP synthase gamma chain [Phycisphaerae bacterium]
MAKARAIIKRRKAVQNIRKITRTMQLIATARFQAAYNRAMATKPYTQRITELVEQLSRAGADLEHPLLRVNTESKRSVLIVITSNRGLCGGYNSALLRAAWEHLRERETAGESVDLHVMGRKGIAYFKFLNRKMAATDVRFEDKPRFADVDAIANSLIDAYERRQIDSVHVTYTKFVSTATQRVTTMQLLPVERPAPVAGEQTEVGVQYEFTPPAPELLAELLPETVKVRLFQCFTDAAVSEQVARMVAMKSATDAAGDMIRSLTQQYNRARQSQITLELLDIVSGAEAIK